VDAPRILVVDDDEAVRYAVCLALSVLGCVADPVSGAAEALDAFRPGRYQAVVTDVAMPFMSGLELARRLRVLEPDLPIMIFSGSPSSGGIEGAMIARKPDVDALTRLVQRALRGP
jgi:CheY-like chemotaxis protein